jgi:PAS domain S-box-containing protein
MSSATILIVEDERIVARDIQNRLTRLGYTVVGVTRYGEEAVRLAAELRPDLVLMDIRLDGPMDGVTAAQEIHNRLQLAVVYLTAYADEETLLRARVTEPFGYILKPFEERELRTAIELALYKHQAERKLRESERRYAITLSSIGDAVIATDDQTRIGFLNPVAAGLTGWPAEEAIGQPLHEVFRIINEQTRQPAENPVARILREGKVIGLANHTSLLTRDGREVPIEDCGAPILDDHGAITGSVLVFHDVSERRRSEHSLTLFRELIDRTNDSIEVVDPDSGCILDVNEHACRSHGYTREEYLSLTVPALDPTMDEPGVWAAFVAHLRRFGSRIHQGLHRRKDGSVFPVEAHVSHIRLDREYLVAIVRDVTERQRAERALVESHSLLNAVVEGTADAVFVKDLLGRYLMINTAGARFLGKTVNEVLGKDDRALFTPDTAEIVRDGDRRVLARGVSQHFEETATAAGVTRTYLATKDVYRDAHGQVIGLIGIARDITEQKRLEEQFRQAQKMEAVGRLAGGVAHDFNNLLTVINGFSEMVFGRLRPDDPCRELLAEIRKAGERAATLTGQLLVFSRKQILQPQVVELNTLLTDLLKLLKRLLGEDIEFSLTPDPNLGLAKVDPGQFEQAIINLAVNARDAMPGGGRLVLETRDTELDASYALGRPEVKPGRYVLVSARDTGHGMDEATKARIFEPFFTTKEPGKGTGLGLAMVYGFVKQSGGHIEVQSAPGRGSIFEIYLPRAAETSPTSKSSPDMLMAPKGTETVLLVEDEDSLRNLSRLILQASGYKVLEARDGQEAVWVAQQHPEPVHLLVTDVVMPRMSGRHLADLLAQARPELRILFMSGYTDEAVLRHGVLEAGVAFLQKPFTPIGLARKVREVLDAKAGTRP